jgi:hypothetical protein
MLTQHMHSLPCKLDCWFFFLFFSKFCHGAVGKVQKVGGDYISLLVLGAFNATVHREDMESVYTPDSFVRFPEAAAHVLPFFDKLSSAGSAPLSVPYSLLQARCMTNSTACSPHMSQERRLPRQDLACRRARC